MILPLFVTIFLLILYIGAVDEARRDGDEVAIGLIYGVPVGIIILLAWTA